MLDSRFQLGTVNPPSWKMEDEFPRGSCRDQLGKSSSKWQSGANAPQASFRSGLELVTCHCWTASMHRRQTGS